jgi:DNA-binding FadR family transcriptional regulator
VTDHFHSLICSMSGNPLLNLLARALKDIYTERVSGLVFPEEKRDHVRSTHEEITAAIERGDAETSERLMRDHMRNYADFFADRYPGLMEELVDWR